MSTPKEEERRKLEREVRSLFHVPDEERTSRSVIARRITDRRLDLPIMKKLAEQALAINDLRRAEYERRRPPKSSEHSGRVIYIHDSSSREALQRAILGAGKLFDDGLAADGGRDGILIALDIAAQLVQRLPLTSAEIDALVRPLLAARHRFDIGDVGHSTALPGTPRKGGRTPAKDPRNALKTKFELRCILALDAVERTENKSEVLAAQQVFKEAKNTADWLGIAGRQSRGTKEGGFRPVTIVNWRKRHTTTMNAWQRDRVATYQWDMETHKFHRRIQILHQLHVAFGPNAIDRGIFLADDPMHNFTRMLLGPNPRGYMRRIKDKLLSSLSIVNMTRQLSDLLAEVDPFE